HHGGPPSRPPPTSPIPRFALGHRRGGRIARLACGDNTTEMDARPRHDERRAMRPATRGEAPSNESLQQPSARSSEVIAVSAYRVASASAQVSRILSRPLAAELER